MTSKIDKIYKQRESSTDRAFSRVDNLLGIPTDPALRIHENLMSNPTAVLELTKKFGIKGMHEYMQMMDARKREMNRR